MMKLAWIYDNHQVAAQMSLYLLHINVPWCDGEQGWRSGENTRGGTFAWSLGPNIPRGRIQSLNQIKEGGRPCHPDPEIRGGGLKKIFPPSGPQFGLKIRGTVPPGPLPWIQHP